MKITKFLFPALIMFLGVSCTHDNSETDYLKNTKSYEDTNWGDLHNKFMSSVKNDFIPNYGSSYEEEEAQLLNFYHDITEEEQSLNDKNKTLFKNSFSDRIKLVNYKYIQAVVKDEQLIYNDLKKENTTFSQYILDLQNTHIISNSEINDIIELISTKKTTPYII